MASISTGAAKTASVMLSVFDGTRQPISPAVNLLVRVVDGNQTAISADYHRGPNIYFTGLPVYDNFGDDYTVIVSADGYLQAGFQPVKISPKALQSLYLMLLPKDGTLNFNAARWEALESTEPKLVALLSHGAAGPGAARDRYEQWMERQPATLAAFLNLTTAMAGIYLAEGTPLDYLAEPVWEKMQQDRFFAWAKRTLVDQVRLAAGQGVFQPVSGALHPGATSSYKQVQFGEANVQLTFHENDRREIDGAECIMVEPDIDYYKDVAAHLLLEVVPNEFSGSLTDPKIVYVLRWIAGKHAGVPEFAPPYTIQA